MYYLFVLLENAPSPQIWFLDPRLAMGGEGETPKTPFLGRRRTDVFRVGLSPRRRRCICLLTSTWDGAKVAYNHTATRPLSADPCAKRRAPNGAKTRSIKMNGVSDGRPPTRTRFDPDKCVGTVVRAQIASIVFLARRTNGPRKTNVRTMEWWHVANEGCVVRLNSGRPEKCCRFSRVNMC